MTTTVQSKLSEFCILEKLSIQRRSGNAWRSTKCSLKSGVDYRFKITIKDSGIPWGESAANHYGTYVKRIEISKVPNCRFTLNYEHAEYKASAGDHFPDTIIKPQQSARFYIHFRYFGKHPMPFENLNPFVTLEQCEMSVTVC